MLKPGVTRAVLMAHGHRCQYCGSAATHADHIIPSALGGCDDASNLIAACASCNCSKGARRLPPEHEHKMLTRAWIFAGEVEGMVRAYSSAAAQPRASFIKMQMTRAVAKD